MTNICEHCGKKAEKIETKQATMACINCGVEDPNHIPFWSEPIDVERLMKKVFNNKYDRQNKRLQEKSKKRTRANDQVRSRKT